MAFDINKLSTNEKAVAGTAIGVLVFSFFPGYGASGVYSSSISVFSMGASAKIGVLLALAAGVWVVLRAADVKLPELPIAAAMVPLALSGLGLLFLAYRFIDLPSGSVGVPGVVTVEFGRKVGLFLVLIASAMQTFFAYQHSREGAAGSPPAE